ncbi:MAG: UDPGP type 1 family protein [Deltaproteobacteria bacterium]|nr:UDPGP type 1 family protein [Deltaproteobacteria bacterium]
MEELSTLRARLDAAGQGHVLRHWDELDDAGRARLADQLAALDLSLLQRLAAEYVVRRPDAALPTQIEPVETYPQQPAPGDVTRTAMYRDARARGLALLHEGKVGAFLVAGGQGTRLGYDGPKGEFPVTPIKRHPLFRVFAEQLRAWGRDARRAIPWYIMTSDANDAATRAYFAANAHFGVDPGDVYFFQQGMMPAFGSDGRLLLAGKDSLALSPDGHGGSLRALAKSGALADMRRRGIEHLSYFQVDNPLVHCIDPLFLGLHDLTGSEMSSKMIPKAGPLEKVGNFVRGDGVLQVIEYSDLPESLARQTDAAGALRFNAGSIAIHALRTAFIERLTADGELRLPWHRADKKVPFVDETGRSVEPTAPNAVKLEQFIFDAIPLASNAIVVDTDRAEEFSPVKNAEGVDSPATCLRDQIRRAARWLGEAAVEVPRQPDGEPDAVLEISPLFAPTAEHVRARGVPMTAVQPGGVLFLGPDGPEHADISG